MTRDALARQQQRCKPNVKLLEEHLAAYKVVDGRLRLLDSSRTSELSGLVTFYVGVETCLRAQGQFCSSLKKTNHFFDENANSD